MKYLNDKFWHVSFEQKHENVVYVLLLTLCCIYFPKSELPKDLLTASNTSYHYAISNEKQAYSMSSSQFNIPFVACFTRFTATLSKLPHNGLYSRQMWVNWCDSTTNFDYQLIRENNAFKLYAYLPFSAPISMTNELHQALDMNSRLVFRHLFKNLRRN